LVIIDNPAQLLERGRDLFEACLDLFPLLPYELAFGDFRDMELEYIRLR